MQKNKEFRFAKLCAGARYPVDIGFAQTEVERRHASHQRHNIYAFACDPHGVFFIE